MQKNSLWKRDDSILRVLDERENEMLVIDCVHPVMPTWIRKDELLGYAQIEESELWPASNGISREDDIPVEAQRIMRGRFTIITGVIPYIMDKGKRSQMIARAAAEHGVCRKTVRHYLCLYLAYQDVAVLAPQSGAVEKALTEYEKNIRWALNKFYYTKNRNSLRTAYTLMLKERYCDEGGNLLPNYPSFHQFRYFYRKHKSLQDYYISREGMRQYQRNHRPLLGDGVQEYASHVGVAMLDSTICDIYLVNEAGGLVGRPILTACIDAYSGLCCGYMLSWEGGTYSLRGLMLSVIEDKAAYCKRFSITIGEGQWDCAGMLPGTLVTDKGSEYASQNFEQIAELGVTVVNLPAYRPELKGVVEKFFDLIQSAFKPHLKGKGVIEPDYQERGAHDYRKDACLTMEQFEKVVLNCILYYNGKRIIENYPYTDDMLAESVQPNAVAIWNYGRKQPSADLIPVSREQLILTLLPRITGRFSRSGLKVNQMRYRHDDYTEQYLQGGGAVVAYNPDDVGCVWLLEKGEYVRFDLIEGRYAGKDLNGVRQAQESRKRLVRAAQEESLQARIDLADHIETIAGTAKKTGDTTMYRRLLTSEEGMKMHIEAITRYSHSLDRDMHMMIYGRGGVPFLAFPTQNSMCGNYEDFGMTAQLADYIDGGRLQLFVVDTVDVESWSNEGGDNAWRAERQEHYYHYIVDEVIPLMRAYNDALPVVTGLSMGANHAAIVFLRRPDLFRGVVALSGVYDSDYFFHGWMNPTLYENSPERFLPNLPQDHPYVNLYNQRQMIFCVGQGAWEEDGVRTLRHLERIFQEKGIHAWCDFWGHDVNHDWPWWYKQMRYFIPKIIDEK